MAGNGTAGYTGDGGPATSADLNYASGIAPDSAGNFYIADSNNNVIRKVTVTGVFFHEPSQMASIQHDPVIERISSVATDPAFSDAVLPRTSEARSLGLDAKALHSSGRLFVEARVPVENQTSRGEIKGNVSRNCCMIQALLECLVAFQ